MENKSIKLLKFMHTCLEGKIISDVDIYGKDKDYLSAIYIVEHEVYKLTLHMKPDGVINIIEECSGFMMVSDNKNKKCIETDLGKIEGTTEQIQELIEHLEIAINSHYEYNDLERALKLEEVIDRLKWALAERMI